MYNLPGGADVHFCTRKHQHRCHCRAQVNRFILGRSLQLRRNRRTLGKLVGRRRIVARPSNEQFGNHTTRATDLPSRKSKSSARHMRSRASCKYVGYFFPDEVVPSVPSVFFRGSAAVPVQARPGIVSIQQEMKGLPSFN
jgi:hypothetical protein